MGENIANTPTQYTIQIMIICKGALNSLYVDMDKLNMPNHLDGP